MDSRLIRGRVYAKKPLLLKDFLLDDLGSCSSNGFKSFPRRQCCSALPFVRDFDSENRKVKRRLSFDKCALPAAFLRSVSAAVKRLPFRGGSEKTKNLKYSLFSGFWNRKPAGKEIEFRRLKSFDELLKEDSISHPSSRSFRWPASSSAVVTECSSGGTPFDDGNVIGGGNDVVEVVATNDDVLVESTTTSEGSVCTTTNPENKQWVGKEKEQLSPVSVLNCPLDDEDEVSSSPFQKRLARMEGTKKKLMKKIHMFESLAKIEPINLASRFTNSLDSDNDSSTIDEKSTYETDEQSISDDTKEQQQEEDDEDEVGINELMEEKALELLHEIKNVTPYDTNVNSNPDKLLLDFFIERVPDQQDELSFNNDLILEEARNWLHGRGPREAVLEWKVEKNRERYVREMEKGKEWKTLEEEIKEVGLVLESEVFEELVEEIMLGILI